VSGRIVELRVGQVQTLVDDAGEWSTAIVKPPRPGPVRAGALGLDGDAQADRQNHGGVDKAILAYAAGHYRAWARAGRHFEHGAFGENLIVEGQNEASVCIGDVFEAGSTRLVVVQPRPPCWKLARLHRDPELPRLVVALARGGWYLRVLVEGTLAPGDALVLQDRPLPNVSVARASAALYGDRAELDVAAALALAGSELFPAALRLRLSRRLEASGVLGSEPSAEL
jgi:MOSC domain-containing protein YiiM